MWLDGALVAESAARIAPTDRGFTLGDGVFETIRATAGRARHVEAHLARLRAGAAILGIEVPASDGELCGALDAVLAENALSNAALRVTLTRGPTQVRGLQIDSTATPTLAIVATPLETREGDGGAAIVASVTRRNERSPLARIKSLNYGDALLARREAIARGANDAILLNTRARVACACAANLFARIDGRWRTPPLEDGALAGTTRARLIARGAIDVLSLDARALARCDALVATTSLAISAYASFEGRALRVDALDLRDDD